MRATRDLMHRRKGLMRQRAELLAHITNTNRQYNLPALGVRPARPAERAGIARHFTQACVRKSIEVDLSLVEHYDRQLLPLERYLESNAQGHDPVALAILRTIHGMGKVPGLSLLYEIHDIGRFARVQQFLSYCRLVKPTKESGGKILGHLGRKIGNAQLKWAFSEAAVCFLRANKPAQALRAPCTSCSDGAKRSTPSASSPIASNTVPVRAQPQCLTGAPRPRGPQPSARPMSVCLRGRRDRGRNRTPGSPCAWIGRSPPVPNRSAISHTLLACLPPPRARHYLEGILVIPNPTH